MATRRWLGTAVAVAQVDKFTPANVEEDDIFTLTATGEDGSTTAVINFTATAATVANVVAGLVAAWNASTDPLHTPITAANVSDEYVTLTADTAGVPFYVASTTTDGGGNDTQTLTRAAVTANAGPNDFDTAANWSGATVPVADDDVIFEKTSVSLLYGLDQSDIEFGSVTVNSTFTGYIGQSTIPLQCEADDVDIDGSGSRRINLDLGTNATTLTIAGSGSSGADTNQQPIRIVNTNATSTAVIREGKVGMATTNAAETSQFSAITVGTINGRDSVTDVILPSGMTLATLTANSGTTELGCAATTVTNTGGALTTEGSGAITTLNAEGGTVEPNSTGTITNLNIGGATVDFLGSTKARTVENCTLKVGSSTLKFDDDVVTFTNDISTDGVVSLTATVN